MDRRDTQLAVSHDRKAWLAEHTPSAPGRRWHRVLLLLVPLTWPGFAYGLWQRRQGLWLSKPVSFLQRWTQWVVTHRALRPGLLVAGSLVVVSAGIYGAVVYGGPLLAWWFAPAAPQVELPSWPVETPRSAVKVDGVETMVATIVGIAQWLGPMLCTLGTVIALFRGHVQLAFVMMMTGVAWGMLPALISSLEASMGPGVLGGP